jgi:alkaline phosphatase
MKFKALLLPFLITSLAACSNIPVQNNNHVSINGLISLQAQGDVTSFSSAAHLKADRSIALKNSIQNNPVKHVILFIGDGTSDSELTSARNYAEGTSGNFKGLDVLTLQVHTSTIPLIKTKKLTT